LNVSLKSLQPLFLFEVLLFPQSFRSNSPIDRFLIQKQKVIVFGLYPKTICETLRTKQ